MSQIGGPEPTFTAAYTSALRAYLYESSEETLRTAYELGREAVVRHLGVLELALVHQEAVRCALEPITGEDRIREAARATGDFFVESLSSFEMVQRGYDEARQTFVKERRRIELSRRLSTFLADASLARDVRDSLQEALRLVCEQARDLIGAACCVTTLSLPEKPRLIEAASHSELEARWRALVRWQDLEATYTLLRSAGGALRLGGEDLARLPGAGDTAPDLPPTNWLGASLRALDGSQVGAIQLFDSDHGEFTDDDLAALVHLAQMASATFERTRLYRQQS